jgi:inner membrane protein
MTGPTHIAFGLASTIALTWITKEPPSAVGWFAVMFGSMAPDIDSPESMMSKPGSLLSKFLPKFLVEILDQSGKWLSLLINKIFGHRGASHWPLIGCFIVFAGAATQNDFLCWFGWGYLGHIIADFCTSGGVPIFGPFYRKSISWSPLKTDSFAEKVFCGGLWLVITVGGFSFLPQDTKWWLAKYASILSIGDVTKEEVPSLLKSE